MNVVFTGKTIEAMRETFNMQNDFSAEEFEQVWCTVRQVVRMTDTVTGVEGTCMGRSAVAFVFGCMSWWCESMDLHAEPMVR